MSTYFPKTFKKWKVQKKCLSCSQEPLKYMQRTSVKQLTIHSIAIDKQVISSARESKPFSQIFQIESPSQKKPSTPSGRKKKNSPVKSSFHRGSWEDMRLLPKGSVKQIQKQEKGTANNNMFRMITKKRPHIAEMKKRLTEKSALEDLIKLVTPSKKYQNQVLQTDEQRKSVRVLEKDQFIPYRVINNEKNVREQQQIVQSNFITSPKTQQKKHILTFCDFSEAMTKIPIGKSVRYKSQKRMGSKLRSFSVIRFQSSKDYVKLRGSSHINVCSSMQIQPWQQSQRHQ